MVNRFQFQDFVNAFRNFVCGIVRTAILLVSLWMTLYSISEWNEFKTYLIWGICVVLVNSIYTLLKTKNQYGKLSSGWLLYASAVLLLLQTGNIILAILLSIFAILIGILYVSFCDLVVGISLLIFVILNQMNVFVS